MKPANTDSTQEAVPPDEPLQKQLRELARLVGGLLARKHLRRPAAPEPIKHQNDEDSGL